MLHSLGLERSLTRFVPEGRLTRGPSGSASLVWRLFAVRMSAAAAACAFLWAAWLWVMQWFAFIELQMAPLPLLIYMLSASASQYLSAVLQALVMQQLLTRINVLQWGGRLLAIVVLVQLHRQINLQQALWVMAIPEFACAVVMLYAVRSALGSRSDARMQSGEGESWPVWRQVVSVAGHSYGFGLLALLPQGHFMRTIVAATLPVDTVAAYGFLSLLIDRLRLYLPIQLTYNLVEPVLVARYLRNGDARELAFAAHLIYKLNLLLLLAALVIVLVDGSAVVALLTSGRFEEYSWILALLLLQLVFGSHVLAVQLVLSTLKANQLLSRSAVAALLVMLVFLSGSALSGHSEAIIIGPLLYDLTVNCAVLAVMRSKRIAYELYLHNKIKLCIIAAACVLGAQGVNHILGVKEAGLMFPLALLAVATFAVFAILARALSPTELKAILRLVRPRASGTKPSPD